jgi:hypothetical protein
MLHAHRPLESGPRAAPLTQRVGTLRCQPATGSQGTRNIEAPPLLQSLTHTGIMAASVLRQLPLSRGLPVTCQCRSLPVLSVRGCVCVADSEAPLAERATPLPPGAGRGGRRPGARGPGPRWAAARTRLSQNRKRQRPRPGLCRCRRRVGNVPRRLLSRSLPARELQVARAPSGDHHDGGPGAPLRVGLRRWARQVRACTGSHRDGTWARGPGPRAGPSPL